MRQDLNVYRHRDGYYLFSPGLPTDAFSSNKMDWLCVVDREALGPAVQASIDRQLRARPWASVSAEQLYAPMHDYLASCRAEDAQPAQRTLSEAG